MKFKRTLITASMLLAASAANAAIITQFGDDVSFTYDDATAYGTGTVLDDHIFFTPTIMSAQSVDGAGINITSTTLNIDVTAITQGYDMSLVSLFENGDYRLIGGTNVGGGASVDAQSFFSVRSLTTSCGLPPCVSTSLYSAGSLGDTAGNLALWNMGGTVDLTGVQGWGNDTSLRLTIQNNLTATTTSTGELAFIQKKFSISIPGVPGVPAVPVPAAAWLFGSGLIGLVAVARRKAS
jgi:hypothetical protein